MPEKYFFLAYSTWPIQEVHLPRIIGNTKMLSCYEQFTAIADSRQQYAFLRLYFSPPFFSNQKLLFFKI